MKDPIYSLLEKYINNTINAGEREVLRSMIDGMTHDQFSEVLTELWENYEPSSTGSYQSFEEFDKMLRPETRKTLVVSPVWRKVLRVAAMVALPLSIGCAVYMYNQAATMQSHLEKNFVFSTKSGDCSEILLPDGTKVILNSASTLSYPANYGMNDRKVQLSGEAFLEVEKDSLHPFIVDTKDLQVKVLGTTFNVKAYENSDLVETTLIEGSVNVKSKLRNNQSLTLKPNQKATLNKIDGRLWAEASEVSYEKAWIDGSLVFRSASFHEVLLSLERYYGLKIEVKGQLPEERFTGYIREKNIWVALRMLQNHYKFNFQRDENTLWIEIL